MKGGGTEGERNGDMKKEEVHGKEKGIGINRKDIGKQRKRCRGGNDGQRDRDQEGVESNEKVNRVRVGTERTG